MHLALADKSLIVIGGTTGLGLSAARAFVAAGARVAVMGRDPASLEKALAELGPAACGWAGDATDPAAVERVFAGALERHGAIHGLYHVAGGSGRRLGDGPLHEITDEGWRGTLDLNLTSVMISNRAAARHFLARGTGGSILNMGSVLGWSPSPHFFATHAYAAAKAAIVGFTKACAAHYAPQGIRFNVLAPALVETPMARRAAGDAAIQSFIRTKQPLDGGRIGVPSDLDAAAVYFLGDASGFTTGQVLAVDGGWCVSEGQIPGRAMTHALGLDIGGTHIKALAVTPEGRVLAEAARPTGDRGTRSWIANVKQARAEIRRAVGSDPSWIGVAAPGLAAPDGLSIHHMPGRLPGLEGLDWARAFRVKHPVPVLNDAHAALLGEVWLGAARGRRDVILLTLGTGVGGAAWVDGRLLRGHLGRAGHLGHISLDPAGPPDIARTPGSLEDAIGECTLAARCGGRFASTRDLVEAARRDPAARAVWLASVRTLGAGIVSLVNVLDPETVLLGGGIAKAGPALFRPLRRYLDQFEWRPDDRRIRLRPARLADRAGAFGAAWQAMRSGMDNSPRTRVSLSP